MLALKFVAAIGAVSVFTWILLDLYGRALLKAKDLPVGLKTIAMLLLYVGVAILICAPLFLVLRVSEFMAALKSSSAFAIGFALAYLLASFPGFRMFQRRYLPVLKSAGVFGKS